MEIDALWRQHSRFVSVAMSSCMIAWNSHARELHPPSKVSKPIWRAQSGSVLGGYSGRGQKLRLISFMWSECSYILFFPCTSLTDFVYVVWMFLYIVLSMYIIDWFRLCGLNVLVYCSFHVHHFMFRLCGLNVLVYCSFHVHYWLISFMWSECSCKLFFPCT